MNVAWWCSGSSGVPWTWTYTPLIGVWLLVGGLVALRELAWRRWAPSDARRDRKEEAYFAAAMVGLFAVSEWPLGPLGAGYLLSVGMLRYVVYTLLVARWLLLGTPAWLQERLLTSSPRLTAVARLMTRWQMALFVAQLVLVVTHLPPVVDSLKVFQTGSFVLDMFWLISGVLLWWPVYGKVAALPRLGDPGRELYLFSHSIVPTVPASFLTFATLPLYGLYELAPPVWLGYDVVADQRVAGLLMKIAGGVLIWGTIAYLFMTWASRQDRIDRGVATERDLAAELASWKGRQQQPSG